MVGICEHCKEVKRLDVHHKDGNHDNDVPENWQSLCSRCHRLAHVDLCIATTGRPGTKPLSDRVYGIPKLPWAEVRRQYFACLPRA